jgi:hypothetical protein
MKKSRKQKSRKIKKSKTRKQKGGDNCEKSNILEKLDESLKEYNNIVYAKENNYGSHQNADYEGEKNNIIILLSGEIKKCDNIKSIKNIIKRKKIFSVFSTDTEFYEKLLEEFKSPIEQQQKRIVTELSKSFEKYKKSKSTKMYEIDPRDRRDENGMLVSIEKIIESQNKTIIESLYETIKNYDKGFIKDIIEKQKGFLFFDSDKKEFYEKILEKLDSQDGQQDNSQTSETDLSIKDS